MKFFTLTEDLEKWGRTFWCGAKRKKAEKILRGIRPRIASSKTMKYSKGVPVGFFGYALEFRRKN